MPSPGHENSAPAAAPHLNLRKHSIVPPATEPADLTTAPPRRPWRRAWVLIPGLLVVLTGVVWLDSLWRPLASLDGRSVSHGLADTADTRLGRVLAPVAAQHPGLSGVVALADGRDAFAARLHLANAAERSIDVEYYIWKSDLSGILLFHALHQAADRGVRVRLLLDDNNTGGLDPVLAALNAHPNVEVRLFNPFRFRFWRALDYLTDFPRLNRRMHNKSFTVDNQATIIGGRNIGDEYFDAAHPVLFIDLDVLAVGPVVKEVSADFDAYWASESAYPAERVLPSRSDLPNFQQLAADVAAAPGAQRYRDAVAEQSLVRAMLGGTMVFEWTQVRMIRDDPAKGLGRAPPEDLFPHRLREVLESPQRELQLVSPYFVPTENGAADLIELAASGVRVSILTNSLESSDVRAVHAGYAKWRRPLLNAGIRLFELRKSSAAAADRLSDRGLTGSSGSSLHAKTFAVDGQRIFIGSYNFDPRSARLNTELGFVIESSALAETLAERFATRIPELAYEVQLGENSELRWVERGAWRNTVHETEPNASPWTKAWVWILSHLPIDSLL